MTTRKCLLHFGGGVRGTLWASQVAPGNENALKLRVYGEKAGLAWAQEDPNYLHYTPLGEPPRLIRRGGAGTGPVAAAATRTPAGHPEGYLEGFANLYSDAAELIRAKIEGREPDKTAKTRAHCARWHTRRRADRGSVASPRAGPGKNGSVGP